MYFLHSTGAVLGIDPPFVTLWPVSNNYYLQIALIIIINNNACHHCGADVNHLGTHGLSCKRSEGRHHRHAALNDIIHRALTSAHIPSRLEPIGIYRSDGKRPDGITVVPWKRGRVLLWDATCPDTFAPSYLADATGEAGDVAAAAERRKRTKYSNLTLTHLFVPVAMETTGVPGPETASFLKESVEF